MPEMAGMRVMCSCARYTPKRSHTQTTRLMLCSYVQIVTEAERKRRAKVGADGTVAAEVESKMKQVSFKASSSNDRLVKVSGFFMRYCMSGTGPQVLWDMQQGGRHQSPHLLSAREHHGIHLFFAPAQAPHLPGRSLSDYLALPLDAYSLLDPTWISRDPTDPNTFLLVVPLQALTGLDLEPRIYIRVDLDSDDAQVSFCKD